MAATKVMFGESNWLRQWPMTTNAATNMGVLKSEIADVVERGVVHAIFEVTAPFAKKPFRISGNLLKLSNYLTDAAKKAAETSTPEKPAALVQVELIGFTTDRNEARKQADEV